MFVAIPGAIYLALALKSGKGEAGEGGGGEVDGGGKSGEAGDRERKLSAPLQLFATTVLTSLVPKEMHRDVSEARTAGGQEQKRAKPKIEVAEEPPVKREEEEEGGGGGDTVGVLQGEGGGIEGFSSAGVEDTPASGRKPLRGLFSDRRRQALLRSSGGIRARNSTEIEPLG